MLHEIFRPSNLTRPHAVHAFGLRLYTDCTRAVTEVLKAERWNRNCFLVSDRISLVSRFVTGGTMARALLLLALPVAVMASFPVGGRMSGARAPVLKGASAQAGRNIM